MSAGDGKMLRLADTASVFDTNNRCIVSVHVCVVLFVFFLRMWRLTADFLQIAQQAYEDWSFLDNHPIMKMKAHNIDDEHLSGAYHFRDDMKLVFGAIERLVTKVVNRYYHTDLEVKLDTALQSFVEMALMGLPGSTVRDGKRVSRFPRINTRQMVGSILWQVRVLYVASLITWHSCAVD